LFFSKTGSAFYNHHVTNTATARPLWARLAAWGGLLAVFSALLAPVSMLAEDVRTGQLGGVCGAGSAAAFTGAQGGTGSDESPLAASMHCDLCCSFALGLPPHHPSGHTAAIPEMVAVFDATFQHTYSLGLPFSRGPPAV
jgi:hypothetical protein